MNDFFLPETTKVYIFFKKWKTVSFVFGKNQDFQKMRFLVLTDKEILKFRILR